MVSTVQHFETMSDGTARLSIIVSADDEECGRVTVLSGPEREVRLYARGYMTMPQVREAWGFQPKK